MWNYCHCPRCLDKRPTFGYVHLVREAAEVASLPSHFVPLWGYCHVSWRLLVLSRHFVLMVFCCAVTVCKCTPECTQPRASQRVINWWRNSAEIRKCPPKSDLLALMPCSRHPWRSVLLWRALSAPHHILCKCRQCLLTLDCYFYVCFPCLLDVFSHLWKLFGYL